jgi:hypothetical protein
MKAFFKTSIFLLIVLIISSCSDKLNDETSNVTIKYGSECGWCGGQEYITITSLKVDYERNIPCGENGGISRKSKNLTKEEWIEITDSFDYSLFKTLEYNECNVCVDGCDEIIRITENGVSHELRYMPSNEIEGMENLQQILLEIAQEMRNAN